GSVLGSTQSNVNNPLLNINNGSLSVAGNIVESNSNYVNTTTTATNTSRLLVNPSTNATVGSTPTLGFGGTLTIGTGGSVDFYGSGSGTSTVNYTGATAQPVYTTVTGLDTSPYTYQNLGFSGAGVKTIQAGTINLAGNWSSAGGRIDAVTNSSTVRFRGVAQTLTDAGSNSGNGFSFGSVYFQGSGTKTISSGKFSVASTGVLTMAGTATLSVGASGTLTLVSDTTSSATVAAVPTGTAITGNVNVQRMIKGSSTSLSKRGYRFISSAVYTATVGGYKCYDVKYLLDSAYVSGMVGGGFNALSANPSLYLYREDILPNNAGFTAGNYKGMAKINNINAYDIGTQKRLTSANTADTTISVPIGNGVLFFFRGNKANNATQTGSKVLPPYDFPEDVPFTQVGQLNTGTVSVRPWYEFDGTTNTSNYLSYTNSPSLSNATTRGFMLVGNPYASTINWEKFNRNGVNSSIYGGNAGATTAVMTTIWMYNPTTKQYDTYIQKPTVALATDTTTTVNPTGSLRTGSASNMIASGQGFLIRATAKSQFFTFRESAKTNTVPTAADLNKVMSIPVMPNALAFSSVPQNNVEQDNQIPVLSFRMIKDSINTDDAVLAFNNTTENTFTPNYDAEDLNGNGALVSLSVISSDDVATAIKQVKLPQANSQVINLLADATASGTYQLKLHKIESLPTAYDVWLKDAFTNDSLDIKHNNTYTFNIDKSNSATYGRNRFKIVVSRNMALSMRALSFKAEKQAQNGKLTWQTENEGQDYAFIVERSTDNGRNFKELGSIRSSGIGTYNFYDIQPVLGDNHYKVRIENLAANTKSYTAVAKLNYQETASATAAKSNVSVYPNPAVDKVNIKIDDKDQNSFSVKITNSFGLVVKELTSSQNNLQENISNLTPGTYLVKVVNTTQNKIEGETKFVKLR
ncbi:MAG: T9SS type A sorting domain-containing protein, partial [Bacteroidota bacterium]